MSGNPERVYFDACVFLSLINGMPDRVPVIDALVQECKEHGIQIVTSALSVTEVAYASSEKDHKTLDTAVLARIDKLWEPGSPFTLVDFHQLIAQEARRLIRESMIQMPVLKGPDALHLATALRVGATHLYTYDEKFRKLRHSHPIQILEPATRYAQLPFAGGDSHA